MNKRHIRKLVLFLTLLALTALPTINAFAATGWPHG